MKKIGLILAGTMTAMIFISGAVLAQGVERNPATVMPSGKTVSVPDKAVENSPVTGLSQTGPVLEKLIFIHYKKGFARPETECGNGICEPGENEKKCPADCGGEETEAPVSCYGFLSKGAKLKSVEKLVISPDLDKSAILAAASEWDENTSTVLFGGHSVDKSADWDDKAPDGRNEFSYGDYPQPGVIGVTVVWGYFSGPPQIREIVEFDVLFDTDFIWGDAEVDSEVMDLQNIATHEIGHGLGLADVYKNSCSEVTMYGYSDYGETKKRDIENADIIGLQSLYGI